MDHKHLWQRQHIISTIRQDLYDEGFLEVETPLLVKATCPDLHIDSIEADGGYLVTSTEYQIKRLIVEGFEKLFTLTKNFRANDRGRYHSSEFTMLEWARVGATLDTIENDAMRFIQKAAGKKLTFKRLTVREAFKAYLGLEDLQDFSLEPMLQAVKRAQCEIPEGFEQDRAILISYLLDKMQASLQEPTFLSAWPAFLTTSAPILSEDPFVADRCELYMGGIEIANGFPFLTDPKVQRRLFEEANSQRIELGKPPVRIDERFLAALDAGMPQGAGMALGMDRLVMALTGASCLADVQAFSWETL